MDTIVSPVSASSIKKDSLTFLKSFFNNTEDDVDSQAAPLPFLSPIANSVFSSCSKILHKPTEELQHSFDTEHPNIIKESLVYARSLLEFCSYQALNTMTRRPDYLADKKFRRLTFDMMLAWEGPSAENELNIEAASRSNHEVEDEEGWSLFYSNSTNMAAQVDDNKIVGLEAFARIAPACTVIADVITVHNLFDVLTLSSGHKLHFLIYDKYLRSLEKVIKSAANVNTSSSASNLQLTEGEIILDIDGTVPTQPIFQHIGISGWPGRLTLTNNAMYFESMGVGIYDKAVKFELAADMKQVIKPDLTGPLGARLYDKAVMYKSTSVTEPVYFEFTEFKGSSRRDYWLDIILEILNAHKFIRMYNLKKIQQSEALARAALGILRYRAVKEAFQNFPYNYKTNANLLNSKLSSQSNPVVVPIYIWVKPPQTSPLLFFHFCPPEREALIMLVYQDLLTGDELLSDSFPYKETENGCLWEVEGKWVVQGAVDVNIGANPSAEGGEDDEGVDDQAQKVVDIVDTFRLQEQPPFDKKQFVAYIKKYIKLLTPKLEGEKQEEFKKGIEAATKFLLGKLKDLQFFVGESMHDDGTMVFAYYKDGATDPTFLYFAHGLKEVKC